MFRWILDDTKALLADLKALGRKLSTRWQWFRLRSRRRIDSAAAELENVRRGAETRTRMCNACRALIPVGDATCPECGDVPGARRSRGLGRVVQSALPDFVTVSTVLLTANMILYGMSNLVWSRLSSGDLPPDMRAAAWNIALLVLGANNSAAVLQGEVWRLVTSMFLHGGLLHLLFNSYALMMLAPFIEQNYGPRKFLVLYLSTGFVGMVVSAWWNYPVHVGIGASGAIFGLIGVGAAWGWRRGGMMGEGIRAQMVQWAI